MSYTQARAAPAERRRRSSGFGLFDRPWPPERKLFGSIRYMSSDNTARKFDLEPYYAYVERLPTIDEARSGRSPGGLRSPATRG